MRRRLNIATAEGATGSTLLMHALIVAVCSFLLSDSPPSFHLQLRSLINLNCPNLEFKLTKHGQTPHIDADGLYGWKHGTMTKKEWSLLQSHPEHVMIVLTKGVSCIYISNIFCIRL